MVSVAYSVKLSDRPQADGRRYVRVMFSCLDHDGGQQDVYKGPRLVAADFDVDTWMSSHEASVLEDLAQNEDQGILDVQSVLDPLDYALNPKWSTTKRIVIAAFSELMINRDPRFILYLEPLITYLKANYTGQQFANLLNITLAKLGRMNDRIKEVLETTGTMKELLVTFDSEEGEF